MFLARKWGNFYETRYADTSGTHGVSYQGGELIAPDMSLFDRASRRAPPANRRHMMLPGYPAQNWCLEIEWDSEAYHHNKGFHKVNRLFSFTGLNGTQIEEVWLLIYPQDDKLYLQVPEPPNPLPIIERMIERPAQNSKYFAVFARELDLSFGNYIDDSERPFLVGYYVIEPNMSFRVPVCSLLAGAPDIDTNWLLDAMGYDVHIQIIY
jgi:hypothetical protein